MKDYILIGIIFVLGIFFIAYHINITEELEGLNQCKAEELFYLYQKIDILEGNSDANLSDIEDSLRINVYNSPYYY